MHVNYEFLLDRTRSLCPNGGVCLDYGCGKGQIVEEGIRRGLEFYGVEAFSAGSGTNIKDVLKENGLLEHRVRELDLTTCKIPFPDEFFDVVVSNQVFEHVVDLDRTLSEIGRVLKTGGALVCIFPTYEVICEGHCGVLFAHWMPKSRMRYCWLLFARCLGFGRQKKGKSRTRWAEKFNEWLVHNVTYRKSRNLNHLFRSTFEKVQHIEDACLLYRVASANSAVAKMISMMRSPGRWVMRVLFRAWGGFAICAEKSDVFDRSSNRVAE